MVFLMGLSVAKGPAGDLIYRGRTWQNELEGAVYTRACVSTVWESCLRKAHPILFLQEKSPYACKVKERIDLGLLLLYKHKNKAEKQ